MRHWSTGMILPCHGEGTSSILVCCTMSDKKIIPTLENVLPVMKKFLCGSEKDGILRLMGGLPCPWCHSKMFESEQSYLATCSKDSDHKVIWIPWGG